MAPPRYMLAVVHAEAAAVHSAFVAAYPGYVAERTAGRDVAEAIEAGRTWLDRELAALLERPYATQRRSPLEVFQEAMRFPTEALAAAGVEPVDRDAAVALVLPGDTYGLAPASSQDLGEEAWRAHLAWGAAKARSLAGPSGIVYFGSNLMDRTAISDATAATVVAVADPADLAGMPKPMLAFVDLAHPGADDAIRGLHARGVRTVAFGPHVDDQALVRARSLGAADALPRSIFFRRLPELLPGRA